MAKHDGTLERSSQNAVSREREELDSWYYSIDCLLPFSSCSSLGACVHFDTASQQASESYLMAGQIRYRDMSSPRGRRRYKYMQEPFSDLRIESKTRLVGILRRHVFLLLESLGHRLMNAQQIAKKSHLVQGKMKRAALGFFTEYETSKMVLIHSSTFGVLLRVMQIILLVYSVIYLLLLDKGYQKKDSSVVSSITLKMKGIGHIQKPPNRTVVMDVAGMSSTESRGKICFD